MKEPTTGEINYPGRLAAVLLALVLSSTNSALLYLDIWRQPSLSEPFSMVLFFLSASAHLSYLFLPFFAKHLLGPVFAVAPPERPGNGSRNRQQAPDLNDTGFFAVVSTCFGSGLCFLAFLLWVLQLDMSGV